MSDGTQLVVDTSLFGPEAGVDAFFSNCGQPGYDCKNQVGTIRPGSDGLPTAQSFTFATATEAIIASANLPTLPFTPGRTETTANGTDDNFNTNATLAPGTYGDINVQNGQTRHWVQVFIT